MATKKFSTFEYASQTGKGHPDAAGIHKYDTFETPFGMVFVVVVNHGTGAQQAAYCTMAIERIKYYMEHDTEENRDTVARNALIYTSGFLYQMGLKDPANKPAAMSCLCVLFSEGKICYSSAGDADVLLFTGKRMYMLNYEGSDGPEQKTQPSGFLGQQALLTPETSTECVEPVNGDMLVLAAGDVRKCLHTKDVRRILQDSMPLQTKVARIMRHSSTGVTKTGSVLIVVSFHSMKNKTRLLGSALTLSQKFVKHESGGNASSGEQKKGERRQKGRLPLWKQIAAALAFIVVVFLFYDLFIYDPHPPIRLPEVEREAEQEVAVDEAAEVAEEAPVAPPPLPADHSYTVRAGDTWSRIYTLYGVCSWFIINHPPNTGRFGSGGSLIAGQRLQIPVMYSAKPDLNPEYFREFTTDKVGAGCQNAGPELLKAFREKTGR
ncbi:MAG: LysM peptidoglycan-binding domain-containing protein [Bacteroidales bacterium]|nr:LysM peptidoglycan-binding domain-containing protein [Bacteroidales bacterium]